MAKPRPSALIPAAARRADAPSDTALRASEKGIATFVETLGGREALFDRLAVGSSDPLVEQILGLISDPRYERYPIGRLCSLAGVSVAQVFAAFEKACIAEGKVRSAPIVADGIVAVVRDVMHRAAPHTITCPGCNGLGRTTPDPTVGVPNPEPVPCKTCKGVGTLPVLPDLDRQKQAIELAQLTPKGGGLVIQQNTLAQLGTATRSGALEQLQQAVGDLLFHQLPAAPPVITVTAVPAAPAAAPPDGPADVREGIVSSTPDPPEGGSDAPVAPRPDV